MLYPACSSTLIVYGHYGPTWFKAAGSQVLLVCIEWFDGSIALTELGHECNTQGEIAKEQWTNELYKFVVQWIIIMQLGDLAYILTTAACSLWS